VKGRLGRFAVAVLVLVSAAGTGNIRAVNAAVTISPSARVLAAASLPSDRLHFGLANGPGDLTWMTSSGVPWKYRYQYLSGGVNTGTGWETWNSPPGAFASYFMNASASIGAIPVFSYYELLQSLPSTGSTELDRDYSNLNNASTMNSYYTNFALLMSMAKTFGQPVVVHVEPDLFAYMEQKAAGGDASTVTASVASSGYASLSTFPNTFQGFAWALLKLRDTIAPNVIMAIHASTWASGIDIGTNTNPAFNLAANADTVAAFLGSAGVATNTFASTFDVVFNDVADRDSGVPSSGRWWDRNDTVLPDFKQWLTWMTELHAKTARQLVVWQVPVGNQYFDTMNQSPGHYQDNRAEYFLSHVSALQAAGIVAVLFGSGGNDNSTTYTDARNDGVTNPAAISTFECNLCNNHISVWPDDDGGYLRIFVGAYYATPVAPGVYTAITPTRLLDTRGGGRLGPGGTVSLTIGGGGIVPANATAVILNVTAVGGSTAGFFTVFPTGASLPTASNLNWVAGETVPNLVSVGLSTTGQVTIFNGLGYADAVVDLEGYFAPSGGGTAGQFVSVVPARITDTRPGSGQANAGKTLGAGNTLAVQLVGVSPIPASGVTAVVLNVTATDTTSAGFFTVFPTGASLPVASNLNWTAGVTVPNRVIVPVGTSGQVSFYNGLGSADVVIDVNGYFTDASLAGASFRPLVPSRILDTRGGSSLGPAATMPLIVAGSGSVPVMSSGIPPTAVVLNVTVTAPTTTSDLVIWPDGTTMPNASDLNFVGGQTVPNFVLVKLSPAGTIDIFNAFGRTHVIVDVVGWYG
jgi:hypothetical protein